VECRVAVGKDQTYADRMVLEMNRMYPPLAGVQWR